MPETGQRRMMAPEAHELKAEGLVKEYRGRRVVNNVDVTVRSGEVVGLLGPNGAGKTTSFYIIVGMIRGDAGRILFDGDDITAFPMYRRARRGVGYLAQEPSIFRKMTVEQNIMAILETLPLERRERKERLGELLEELDISSLAKSRAMTLSGGERRRLEITRALVTRPKFILLDEPFAGVDPIAVEDIQKIVLSLKAGGLGVLITDHNVRETLRVTDRSYIMSEGSILKAGSAEELVKDPVTRAVYFGESFSREYAL